MMIFSRLMVLLATPLGFLVASCALAQEASGLTLTDEYEIRQFVPNADLSGLTPAQASALVRLLHDGDGFDTSYRIRSILLRATKQKPTPQG